MCVCVCLSDDLFLLLPQALANEFDLNSIITIQEDWFIKNVIMKIGKDLSADWQNYEI